MLNGSIDDLCLVDLHLGVNTFVFIGCWCYGRKCTNTLNTKTFEFVQIFFFYCQGTPFLLSCCLDDSHIVDKL